MQDEYSDLPSLFLSWLASNSKSPAVHPEHMRIAILASEVVPFAKTGGLADVAGALPKALAAREVDARVILPLYDQIDRSVLSDDVIDNVPVQWRGQVRPVHVYQSDAVGAPAYLIDAPEYFSKPSIYGYSNHQVRLAFFSRAALKVFKSIEWQPDVVNGND